MSVVDNTPSDNTRTVLLCGVGGQGTITAADLLARAGRPLRIATGRVRCGGAGRRLASPGDGRGARAHRPRRRARRPGGDAGRGTGIGVRRRMRGL